MRLALDNDFFCKMELWDLAEPILAEFGTSRGESLIVDSLLHGLKNRRGKVYNAYKEHAGKLLERALEYQVLGEVSPQWLAALTPVHDIDPGEAKLVAHVADAPDVVLLATHDKRFLRAARGMDTLCSALSGRVLVVEAALQRLCLAHGTAFVRERLASQRHLDKAIGFCLGDGQDASLEQGLASYLNAIQQESDVSLFWRS